MKFVINLLLVLGLFVSAASAATLPENSANTPNSQDRKQMAEILIDVEKAINASDLKAITRHMHPDIVVAWYNAEVSYGVAEVEAYYNRMLKAGDRLLNSFSTSATVTKPAVIHGSFAVASGTTRDHLELIGGSTLDIPGIWTASLVKENGEWKISSIHFSTNTFDNPVSGGLGNMVWIAAIGGLLAGLLVMWLLMRRQ